MTPARNNSALRSAGVGMAAMMARCARGHIIDSLRVVANHCCL
jgi:hypothetical protein